MLTHISYDLRTTLLPRSLTAYVPEIYLIGASTSRQAIEIFVLADKCSLDAVYKSAMTYNNRKCFSGDGQYPNFERRAKRT